MTLPILTADLIEGFAGMFLSGRYDDAKPTPPFHRAAWGLYVSPVKQAMVIAPRDHAKSTGLTFDYILAEVCFRHADYVILIGSTEEKASEQLSNISEELHENEDLRKEFGISHFETDQKTEIIVVHDDGYRFRILARGAEQKIRGALWNGKRPNLIVCDDMEDDEQVESKERRSKFRRWFFRAAKQALSKKGRIRVHGTILHDDSLLARLMKNKIWVYQFYKAHNSYNDFTGLLWPERWTAEDLRNRQIEFEEDGDAAGYSQEFLNTPLDNNEAYLRKQDFLPMSEDDYLVDKKFSVGVDFAISKEDIANKTSFTVGGQDVSNLLHITDQRLGRWGTLEIIEEFFLIQSRWNPQAFFVENGQIWLAIQSVLYNEMRRRDTWLNCVALSSVKDKGVRGRAMQKRHRGGGMRFDKRADWYQAYEAELLRFTTGSQAIADDQFDSSTILCRGLEVLPDVEQEDFMEDEELEEERDSNYYRGGGNRNAVTGY